MGYGFLTRPCSRAPVGTWQPSLDAPSVRAWAPGSPTRCPLLALGGRFMKVLLHNIWFYFYNLGGLARRS